MSVDPTQDLIDKTIGGGIGTQGQIASLHADIAELRRQVNALSASPVVQVVTGVPAPAQIPREGTLVGNKTGPALGLWINGAFRYVGVS